MQDSDPNHSLQQQEWQAFWLALGFLTRFPMLVNIDYSQQLMNRSSLYFPLVGLLAGVAYLLLYAVLSTVFSPLVSLLLVVCFHLWGTGAFHEDGLADSVDALGGGYTLEARLRIMKDSRIGTYGTVALVMALALKVALLLESPQVAFALLLAPCISRLTPLLLMRALPYVTDPERSKSKPVADGFGNRRLTLACGFVAVPGLALWPWLPGLPLAIILSTAGVALAWGTTLKRQLGGYTGDALGASVVFSELVFLALLAL